jgi:ABC-2 type transport system ATP-binding protein
VNWGVKGLTVHYGDKVALNGVDFELAPGQVRSVVGGDGAGKTTLLRALAGALQPTSGTVNAPQLTRIGFMPTAAGVWRELSVDENIDFVAAAHGLRGSELAARRAELLAAAGLEHVTSRLAGQLSGGMRQKLAFSLAMLHRPDVVILDEPSTGVDPVSRVDLWRMVSKAAAGGAAIALATTYLDEAERTSQVLVLDAGEPLLFGTPDEVVAGIPGHVSTMTEPPRDEPERARSWRRGHEYRRWSEGPAPVGQAPADDLEDALVAASLAKELRNG